MNYVVKGKNVSEAWKQAVLYLHSCGGQAYNLIAEIENPTLDNPNDRRRLNEILENLNDQSIETVANTIFPHYLDTNKSIRTELYENYYRLYSELRNIPQNAKGTYFGRLVCWDYEHGVNFNQVENTVQKLLTAKQSKRKIRVRYELGIYDPILDNESLMGFPCMSFISIKIRGEFIDLTAIYRNQYFVQKAYGNYLGLGRLLEFIAKHSGFEIGKLTCIATHADIGSIDRENYSKLLALSSSIEQILLDI